MPVTTDHITSCMNPFIWNAQNRQIYKDRKRSLFAWAWSQGWGGAGMGCDCRWVWDFLFGWLCSLALCSKIRLWWWVYNSVKIRKTIEFYTLGKFYDIWARFQLKKTQNVLFGFYKHLMRFLTCDIFLENLLFIYTFPQFFLFQLFFILLKSYFEIFWIFTE